MISMICLITNCGVFKITLSKDKYILIDSSSILNILLQEDLIIRGGAQLWLMNCGSRLVEAGHKVTFLLGKDSLIQDDCAAISGATVETYDREKIAEDPESFRDIFTTLLTPANVCVTLVRQKRGKFQNVSFMASCIAKADLKTFLIAKTGTPDPKYEPSFYGGDLLDKGQCHVITIANYTRDFIIEKMGINSSLITNIYNGTDTKRFKRTPEMAVEALKRYPLTEDCFAVGCVGSLEQRKGQSVLLEAAKKLIDDQRIPKIHILMVGEGQDKEMLEGKIEDLGLKDHATMYPFTKQPFYIYERCNVIALPSVGKEGLPNVLLEALAMEKPCVASRIYGCPEVVVEGKTGYCCEPGDVNGLADALAKIYTSDTSTIEKLATSGKELIFSEHDKKIQFEKILAFITDHANNSNTKDIFIAEKNLIDVETFRILLLDGEQGTVACKVWGHLLGATIPRISDAGTAEWIQASRRSCLRMGNLTAVRGGPDAHMLGPMDYFGNLGNLHKSLFAINVKLDPPLIYQYPISENQAKNHKNSMGSLDPSPFITTIKADWVSGKDKEIIQIQNQYDVTKANLKQSLFDLPGLLEVHQTLIELQSEFDPVHVNLSSFRAQLIKSDIHFQVAKQRLPSKDDYRLVTYIYQPGYSNWQTKHGSGHFLEKHKFSQLIMPMTEDSHGFVVLARTNDVPDELELVGIEIPFGYALIIEDGCIHGDTSLSGFFMMGMTADHTTMRTADTVFLKSSESKQNVEVKMIGKENHHFNMPARYPALLKNRTNDDERKFKNLTKGQNFIYNPSSREWSKVGKNPIIQVLSNKLKK